MPRLMSVALTASAVTEKRKTVTRRLGWWEDKNGRRLIKPGDHLQLCRKVMGRRAGEPLERLALVEVIDVRREPLARMLDADVPREGVDPIGNTFSAIYRSGPFSGWPPAFAWREWFCEQMNCTQNTVVTRIEWRYLDIPRKDVL